MRRNHPPSPSETPSTASASRNAHRSSSSSSKASKSSAKSTKRPAFRSSRSHPSMDGQSRFPRVDDPDALKSGQTMPENDSVAVEKHDGSTISASQTASSSATKPSPVPTDGADLEQLKQAVNIKMSRMHQARLGSPISPSSPNNTGVGLQSAVKVHVDAASTPSPSLEASFGSLLPTGAETTSTESTESTESGRTVRGSNLASPAQGALRTPSYPFPVIPRSLSRQMTPSFHQPFTALSPTVNSPSTAAMPTPRDRYNSFASTDAFASNIEHGIDGYPTPDIYDIILRLSCDPTLDSWWSTLSDLMHEWFKAERMSLALPADPTDIENVPWGQKAAFNMKGLSISDFYKPASIPISSSDSRTSRESSAHQQLYEKSSPKGLQSRARPQIETRHSYTAQLISSPQDIQDAPERGKGTSSNTRPVVLRRTTVNVPVVPGNASPSSNYSSSKDLATPHRTASINIQTQTDLQTHEDIEQDSSGKSPERSCALVFPILHGLNRDTNPLLNTTGVNRILDRGKLITLTREYPAPRDVAIKEARPKTQHHSGSTTQRGVQNSSATSELGPSEIQRTASKRSKRRFGIPAYSIRHGDEINHGPEYEEYEQLPTSPWAQSPAPSPAIHDSPQKNPFFVSGGVDEGSFNPTSSGDDYAQYGQVEAIGVDNASTIIHIPLIHPSLSRSMQTFAPEVDVEMLDKSTSLPAEDRKAPIAILSVLTPAVPFPPHLIQSLRLLSPHLATSFHNSFQYTDISTQLGSSLHRRNRSGNTVGFNPISMIGLGLDNLASFDMDESSVSRSGSINSPSDYSGRSRYSPGNSLAGTPGWDSHSVGYPKESSTGVTPGISTGSDLVDSYFDAKKRIGITRASSAAAVPISQLHSQVPGSARASSAKRSSTPVMTGIDESSVTKPESKRFKSRERQTSMSAQHIESGSAHHGDIGASLKKSPPPPRSSYENLDQKHSLLHSYGADFSASFQSLPVAAALHTPGGPQELYDRTPSAVDMSHMPPPSERLLRTMMDALPVQIFLAAPGTGALAWVNSKLLVYRGQSAREILENPFQSLHPDDSEEYQELWNQSLRTGRQMQHKVRLKRFDDQYRWYYVRVLPLRDKRQNIVHWIGTCMDLHEQHVAELNAAKQQETAASEAKYRALANSSPQIVFAVTRNRGVTFCNTQWLDYSGQTEEEAHGPGFMDRVHPEDLIKCKLPLFEGVSQNPTNVPVTVTPEPRRTPSSMSTGQSSSGDSADTNVTLTKFASPIPQRKLSELAGSGILKVSKDVDGKMSYSTEVRLRNKDGEYRWHLVRVLLAEPILQVDETEETWYGSCTDINDHKLLEKTLKETMDAKSRFLSNMSHEIRTPLNGIHGMVNFLIDSSLTQEQMDQVNVIRASTEGLRDLINDILDLSKVEAGMITLNMSTLNTRSIIEEVNDLTSSLAMDKSIELNYLIEDDVPPRLKGDRFRVRQVLLNVIGNAIKFTQDGEVFVRCKVAEQSKLFKDSKSIMIQFDVADTGSGFTEKEAELLFKRFSQIDGSSTRQHGGTGLGLVISMQLVELHGGTMSATSAPGKGSTFTFSIECNLVSESDILASTTPEADAPSSLELSTNIKVSDHKPPESGTTLSQATARSVSATEMVESPAVRSSASSDPSIRTSQFSGPSTRSSASSHMSPQFADAVFPKSTSMKLQLPSEQSSRESLAGVASGLAATTSYEAKLNRSLPRRPSSTALAIEKQAPMFSILVTSPLPWTLEATVKHIETTLPQNIPHQITAQADLEICLDMLGGEDPVMFTHVVLVVQHYEHVTALMDLVFKGNPISTTSFVVIHDVGLKRELKSKALQYDFDKLQQERRIHFILKPLKPSKLSTVFDPGKERESSTDHNQSSAQQIAVSQKQVFDEMTRRLGNKNLKVLLVEDNKINQIVMLKLLKRVSIEVDTVPDGVECTDKIFSRGLGYYSIVLCDLHMPRKDGYQTCRDIRRWEQQNQYPHVPIVALSANVLGDVYTKCANAGFNSYLTKPVEFRELCEVMTKFLDPDDLAQPLEFMSGKWAK